MLVVRWLSVALKARCPTDGLLTVEQFRRVLERERCRADRTGTKFTTIAIGMGAADETRTASKKLASHLVQRLRMSDAAGWLGDGRVGILLADTEEEGARQFCRQLREQLAGHKQLRNLDFELLIDPSPEPEGTCQVERRIPRLPCPEGNAMVSMAEAPGAPF
jgi:hypothetical protein